MKNTSEIVFNEDFRDGIWTKYSENPVMVRSQSWAESEAICEPNVLFEEGLFRMWFSQMFPPNGKTALGYATSRDGFTWVKYPQNPVLTPDHAEVHRPSVMRHAGKYYLFGVDDEYGKKGPATMRRWTSTDGIAWSDERLIMTATQKWENNGQCNMAVVVDENGRWHMLYTADSGIGGRFGYAWSEDGVTWTKHEGNPVLRDFYGGDPFLIKLGDWFYTWHSQSCGGGLRIVCRRSKDMVNWERVGGHPQINYTQLWERQVPPEKGGTALGYCGHITDATLCEANGRVFFIYQGAQTPLGVATFDGTFTELVDRLQNPPLSRWEPSCFGMVEGGTLNLADEYESERAPLVVRIPGVTDRYVIQTRIRCYAGPTHRVSVVLRYADVENGTFARVWLHDPGKVFYQEYHYRLFSRPILIGSAPVCDDAWHDWEIEVDGSNFRLTVDERPVGEGRISAPLMAAMAQHPVHVGFSTFDTWASIAHLRVHL
jgi:predicted GH43/DUF377 family glycosyl hydrolase